MDVRTKTTGFDMTEALGAYLDERIAHIEKMLGEAAATARCEVELARDAGRPRHGANIWMAEITLIRPGHEQIRATNHSESINGAIDDVKDEVAMQLRKHKQAEHGALRKEGAELKDMLREE
jgi:ribosomal subunit interface protein